MPTERDNLPAYTEIINAHIRSERPDTLELPPLTESEVEILSQRLARRFLGVLAAALFFVSSAEAAPAWEGIVVHITDSSHMSLDECNAWHSARGWSGCGYNYVIEPDGKIYEGRGPNKVGAHVKGHNSKFLGLAFVSTNKITEAQIESYLRFKNSYGDLPIYPHSHFNNGKRCPGMALEQINAKLKGGVNK